MRPATSSVRLLAVDPHELIVWGLRTVLTQQPWVERCLQATDLKQAGALAERYTPHVILVERSLAESGLDGLHVASPSSQLVVMTERRSVPSLLIQGACGFVSKAWGIEEIVAAVRLAGLGLGLAPPELAGDAPHLTPREEQVMSRIARGSKTNEQIAIGSGRCRRTRSSSTPAARIASSTPATARRPSGGPSTTG